MESNRAARIQDHRLQYTGRPILTRRLLIGNIPSTGRCAGVVPIVLRENLVGTGDFSHQLHWFSQVRLV